MGTLRDDLMLDGTLCPSSRLPVSLEETHISWVFLTETEAWKIKKPVDLGFLDFRTLDARREACEAEVRLNRRLSDGVYLAVVPVVLDPAGRHQVRGPGTIVDWAVRMRRLPDDRRADVRLSRGVLSAETIDAIATRLARFHAAAEHGRRTSTFGDISVIRRNTVENFAQTRHVVTDHLSTDEAFELENWQTTFLCRHEELFEARARGGRIRDGHGDLRLEHVYIDPSGAITILDCIEFNERFRYIDVCADVAFLSMDLAWHGRVDLAERLLGTYAREADDYDLYAIVDFYASYRALVRAKISTLLHASADLPIDARARAGADARRYFLLALAASRRPLVCPRIVAVGGIIASGKSTVAGWIGEELGAPIIDADRTRKHMLGVVPTEHVNSPAWAGAYDLAFTDRVYGEVLRRAEVVLASGRPAILDASFRSSALRQAARDLAARAHVPFTMVECRAPGSTCRTRLAQRAMAESVSDGRAEVFDDFVSTFQPMNELDASEHVVLDTCLPQEATTAALRAALAPGPRALLG